MTRPPRLATWLLTAVLHPDEREELLGDLQEQFERRLTVEPLARARRWYWRQALSLGWGFTRVRRDLISTSHERMRGRWAATNAALDARYAWRSLCASRAFVVVALLTLTVGIGLSTAVFSLVDSVLLEPLPYPNPDRLVRLTEIAPPTDVRSRLAALSGRAESSGVSDVAIGAWVASARTLEAVTPYTVAGRMVTTPGQVEEVDGAEVGGAFFNLLGTQPLVGRLLVPADSARGAPPAAVLSEHFWRTVFHARPTLIGSSLTIDDTAFTVVGIAPDLAFPDPGVAVWTAGQWLWPAIGPQRNFWATFDVLARVRPDATLDEARAEGAAIMLRIAKAHEVFAGSPVPVATLRIDRLREAMVAPVHAALVTLLVGMTLVLLASGVNLASLLLARGTARRREVAIRLALGAARWRLVRPLLFEQLFLSGAGAAAGALLGWWIVRALPAVAPANLPRLNELRFNVASLLFAGGGALAIGLLAGLLPAWHIPAAAPAELGAARGAAGRRADDRSRRALVVLEVALASTLLVGASLIGRTLMALLAVNPGYQPQGVLLFQVAQPEGWWRATGREARFYADLLSRLAQNPAVVAAGASSTLPLLHIGHSGSFSIVGRPKPASANEAPIAVVKAVTPGYFDAIGSRILRGRAFSAADSDTAEKVAVIDASLAQTYFNGDDPLGQHIGWTVGRVFTVVGLVEGAHQAALSQAIQPTLYLAAAQLPEILAFDTFSGGVAVRTRSDPADLVPFVRTAVKELEPTWPVHGVVRLEDQLNATFAEPRFYALAIGLFAALALSTAILGVYGVLAYSVERRRIEFGVRRALGAGERQIRWLVVRQGLGLAAVGLPVGLVVAASGAGLLRSQLFGVGPLDPTTFASAGAVVGLVALAAGWQPARRALRVDPVDALRME